MFSFVLTFTYKKFNIRMHEDTRKSDSLLRSICFSSRTTPACALENVRLREHLLQCAVYWPISSCVSRKQERRSLQLIINYPGWRVPKAYPLYPYPLTDCESDCEQKVRNRSSQIYTYKFDIIWQKSLKKQLFSKILENRCYMNTLLYYSISNSIFNTISPTYQYI